MLTFDAIKHEYRVDGAVLPSVTQVLASCYDFSMVAPDVLERKRQIGVATHRAIQLSLADDLDESSIRPEWEGYFRAWQAFRREARITAFGAIEKPLYHPKLRYAGTPDVPLCLNGTWSVLDAKTADDTHPAWALQLAGYQELLNVNAAKGEPQIEKRFSLRLRENGTYRLDEFTDRRDFTTFLAALTVHRWKEEFANGRP